jgi:hypothetical protein
MKFEKLNEPYEIETGHDGDRLVQITIRGIRIGASEEVAPLADAYNRGNGRVTDEYLAMLAVAYERLAPGRRDVSTTIARGLGKPLQTVKGHIMRARTSGFLTEAVEGKEGGKATPKAHSLLASMSET